MLPPKSLCIPVNMISLPDALNFHVSPDIKVLSHFVPLLVSCRLEHLVNSCVLCSPVAQMVQLVSNSSLSLVLINHVETLVSLILVSVDISPSIVEQV